MSKFWPIIPLEWNYLDSVEIWRRKVLSREPERCVKIMVNGKR